MYFVTQFSPGCSFLDANVFLSTLSSNTLSLGAAFYMTNEVSQQQQKNRQRREAQGTLMLLRSWKM
jgi:hypothetical protein